MIPFLNLYIGFLMDVIVDESSEEETGNLSDHSEDMLSDASEENDDNLHDPDYVPGDTVNVVPEETQPVDENAVDDASLDREEISSEKDEQVLACAKPSQEVEKPVNLSQQNSDDDGQTCTICFEPWTNSSEHRLVSLRCGHLFGRSCITRWLKGQNSRCPQCNARARKSEIRNIYSKAVKVIDSTERDKALQDLVRETELRRTAEICAAHERIKHMLAVQECERLKKELMEAQKQLQEYRSGLRDSSSTQAAKPNEPVFVFEKSIDISRDGGCRIVDTCDLLGMLLVSQPSSNGLFPGYGFRKISTYDMRASEFVLVHQRAIRDMAFHTHDGLVLTASIDKSLKITNIISNTVVQTYNLNSDVWSCAWDADDSRYFYGGLKTGEVYVFDIRVTNRHVYELPKFGSRTPVVSLQYLRNLDSTGHRKKCGPIVGKLSDCVLHQKTENDGMYNIVPLPSLGPFTCLSSEPCGHFLISCRPSPKQSRVNHTVCEFVTSSSGDLQCNPILTVLGGKTQVQLTRSKLLSHPDKESSLLLCAGDEDARGALIWDGSSGCCIDNLRTKSPVLDLAGVKVDQKSILTTLTDKSLRIYTWNGSN